MKNLTNYIQEGLKVNSKSKFRKYNYFPETKDELKELGMDKAQFEVSFRDCPQIEDCKFNSANGFSTNQKTIMYKFIF